jgi:hypothetical protein
MATAEGRALAARSTELNFSIRGEMELGAVAQAFAMSGLFKDLTDSRQDGDKAQREAMVKVLAGREMGMEPVQAMMGLQIVEGRLGLTADAMAARIQSHPDYRYRIVKHTRQICEIAVDERYGDKWDEIGSTDFSIWDAEEAGLCKVVGDGEAAKASARSQRGNKLPWEAHTRNLLFARAISNVFRFTVPHLKLPRLYTEDELREISNEETAGGLHKPASDSAQSLDDALEADFSVDKKKAVEAPEPPSAASEAKQAPVAKEPESGDETPASAGQAAESKEPPPVGPTTPADHPPSSSGAPPADGDAQVDYQAWLKAAATFKQQLGDEVYQATLGPFIAEGSALKANAVPPASVADALAALGTALENQGGPSGESLEIVAGYKKPELIAGIQTMEKSLELPQDKLAALREKHGVGGKIDKATLELLRPYAAHLLDTSNAKPAEQPELEV